ncbi:MAG TPA: multicopper oxidase family protein, partial [Acidimicrobiia bacterium]|nr:multicopper oxidase family protein [Acidimicrobiia bacterium]
FYHDHTHFLTLKRWWMGMAGFFILEDDVEGALPLPRGRYELPLMITDRSFDSNNQLVEPFGNPVVVNGRQVTGIPPVDDVVGATTLVNGVVNPHLEVEARRYRLRVLNAAVYRPYALRLNGGGTLTQIGTESGLQPVPTEMPNYFLGPAQRVELVADFTGLAGKKVLLESVNTLPPSSLATAPAIAPLLQFRVKEPTGPDPTSVPDELRPLPYWVGELDPFRIDRVWIFSYGSDGKATAWTINGFAYDHSRIDGRPELGSTETWALINATPQRTSHYIHLHDVDWYLVSRNGRPAPPDEIGVKETFRIDPGEVAVVGTKFTDFVGPYMLHCHMVNHEDHGMMARWDVTDRGRGDLRAYRGEVTRARMNGHGVDVRTPGLTPFARACALDVLRQISERPGQAADVRAASEAGYATGTSPVVGTPTMYCDVPR